ncbi:response regulator [Reyranella sp.]|uniref:response regulator n=1 Tax=Reyranella sp. TaxID=1929291 RepID=UPI003BAA63F6
MLYRRRVLSGRFLHLRMIVVLSLLVPAVLFGWATWETRRTIDLQADERIERTLDVLQEHALKALQTVERSIAEINEVVRDLDADQILAREADLFVRFKRTQLALPQIESILVFDRTARPLVSSTLLPVPKEVDISDRSYFRGQREADVGTYVSEVIQGRVRPLRFFVVSARRLSPEPMLFDGVVGVTVLPAHFSEFYAKLARDHEAFALVRSDGAVLARWPEVTGGTDAAPGVLTAAFARQPDGGLFTAVSRIDGIERRSGYRRVPGFPIYVAVGIAVPALDAEFWRVVMNHAAIALPAALVMVGLGLYALRRAEGSAEEQARREAAEVALKQSQRLEAIGQLTGGVAHDFNNLLMIVSGSAERLRRLLAADGRLAARPIGRSLDAIDTAVKRGTDLTRQLLSFARRQAHDATVIDLRERLPAVHGMLQSSLRGDIEVQIVVASDVWPVLVDDSELELALLNLAVNARDAMSAGGRLVIAARNVVLPAGDPLGMAGEFVSVSVSDTGSGIPHDLLGRVFEPFFTTKDVGKGTGLGLSQVYGFARQSGGSATVDSVVGRGTTVTLYLPRTTRSAASAPGTPAAPPPRLDERVRVLLVEDNADVAEVTRALLEEVGYAVVHAPDGATAWSLLARQSFDIVLSDIVMPGEINGLDLARRVRRERPGLPVVLATGYSERAQSVADEGFPLLRKPYDAAILHAALSEALASRNAAA